MRNSQFFFLTLAAFVLTKPINRKSEGLDWQPCDLDFPPATQANILTPVDCATLEVPLDYTNPDSKPLQLQLIRVSATEQPAKGSVVFSPGGPGISGVEEVAQWGATYGAVLGGQYDIVGFDPRGVGRTIPFSCESEQANKSKRDKYQNHTVPIPMTDAWSLLQNKAWEEGGVLNELCVQEQKETGRFLSTAFVARDLLRIAEMINEDGLLRLWGRSYGTILGQTFAAMFPDKVERLLLDSVVLPNDYYNGQWLTSTRGTDEALAHFFYECIETGPLNCPLATYHGNATTPESLLQAFSDALEDVIAKNITLGPKYPVQPWFQSGTGLPLANEIKYSALSLAYRPNQYAALFLLINDTLAGNFSTFTDLSVDDRPEPAATWSQGVNAFHGIACLDSSFRAKTREDMYVSLQAQVQGGGMFADSFSPQVWPCAQWKLEPAERYEGKFRGVDTKNPVMLVNSPFDPITPLNGAFKAATAFLGSRLLVHQGHGHGLSNHPSLCTLRAIRDYFVDGELPSPGAKCTPALNGFDMIYEGLVNNGTINVTEDVRDEKERKMLELVYRLALGSVATAME